MKKHTLEEKKKIADKYIKANMDKEDINLVQLMYAISFTSDIYNGSNVHERLKETKFSNLDDLELMNRFHKDYFNTYDRTTLEHLFQEVYNRQTLNAGCEPNHIISVKENGHGCGESCMGYLVGTSNELNLNAPLIEKAVKGEKNVCDYTPENVSSQFLMITNHETQHGIQYQKELNFLIDEKMDKYDEHQAALNFMVFAVRHMAGSSKDEKLKEIWKDAYWYVNNEHDANMAAVKNMKNMIENGKGTKERKEALREFAYYTLRTSPEKYNYEVEKQFIKDTRVEKMSNLVIDLKGYFEKLFKDSPIKEKVLQSVNEYVRKPEGKKSLFEQDLINDFNICDEALKLTDDLKNKKSAEKISKKVNYMLENETLTF